MEGERREIPCVPVRSPQICPVMADNKKLGCLSIFLFVALCVSVFVNLVLVVVAIGRLSGGSRQEEATPRFRETIVQRGNNDKIAVISARPDQFLAAGQRRRFDGGRHAGGFAAGAR